jgi:iron complex transport system substrate-binding protein
MLEWIDPPFCAGHWTPELVRMAGGVECVGREAVASTTTAWEKIIEADPEMLIIACCGFDIQRTLQDLPILQAYPHFETLRAVRAGQVVVMDGNAYFNRPGPRLVDSLEMLAHTLHPEFHPLPERQPARSTLAARLALIRSVDDKHRPATRQPTAPDASIGHAGND